jgi:hypothetical protein
MLWVFPLKSTGMNIIGENVSAIKVPFITANTP